MELEEIFQIIWKRLWLIVLGTLLIAMLVFAISTIMKPVYQAKVTLMVDQSINAPFSGYVLAGEGPALTYSELLKARPLLEIVIARLGLDLSPDDLVEDMISTNLIPDTQLLELTVEDTDAQRASDIANEIAFTFISLHNTEQQLENIVALEQDIVAQMADLKEFIEYNRLRISSSRLTNAESNLIQATLSGQQSAYAGFLATYLNIRLTQAQLLDVTVAETAIPPTEPIRPNIVIYTFLGTFVGFAFSVGLVFLIEFLDRSFETDTDIRRILSLPTLGNIPRLRGEMQGYTLITSDLALSPASEAYRTLRTNIRFVSVDEPLTTLLITSAEPGTGKTTVAANLSVVCAQAGIQVVVIDTDLRRPNLHRLFDLENHTGLTDLLVGDIQSVEECMVRTEIDNLRLITSGPIPPNPSELLGSKRMEAVLAEVQKSAELIILDISPILAVTDPAVLASKVDGVIFVIEAKRTSHEAARRAYEGLHRVGATILGAVVTKTKPERKAYYYYTEETQPTQHRFWKRWSNR